MAVQKKCNLHIYVDFELVQCYRHFRFKTWTGSIYIDFVGSKLFHRKTVRGMKVIMALRYFSLGKTFVSYLVGRSFATECFCTKHETFFIVEDMIHSLAAPICLFKVSLRSSDLNQSCQ